MRIVHITSVHSWDDTRIFVKMCRSLVDAGHEVHLVAPCNMLGTERHHGVDVHPVPRAKNRFKRMFSTVREVITVGARLNGDIYHFHDPEFLWQVPKWQRILNRPFVYDAHEDYREKMSDKQWLPKPVRPLAAVLTGYVETKYARQCAGIVAATSHIYRHFNQHPSSIIVHNFPVLDEFKASGANNCTTGEAKLFVYVGGLTEARGIIQMVKAMEYVAKNIELHIAGVWETAALRERCMALPGWSKVRELGYLDRKATSNLLSKACGGVVLLHPTRAYLYSYPIKMFEYMAAGIPVLASDFPLWREIVQNSCCGVLVDPFSPAALAEAISNLAEYPLRAKFLGDNGRRAVLSEYNWKPELIKLQDLYTKLLSWRDNRSGHSA